MALGYERYGLDTTAGRAPAGGVGFVAQRMRPSSRSPYWATTIKEAPIVDPVTGTIVGGNRYAPRGSVSTANMNYRGMGQGPHTSARPTFRSADEYYAGRDEMLGNPLDNLELGNREKMQKMAATRYGRGNTRGTASEWAGELEGDAAINALDGMFDEEAAAEIDPRLSPLNVMNPLRGMSSLVRGGYTRPTVRPQDRTLDDFLRKQARGYGR